MLVATVATLILLGWLATLVLPEDVVSAMQGAEEAFVSRLALEIGSGYTVSHSKAHHEYQAAQGDQELITNWVVTCTHVKDSSYLPAEVRVLLDTKNSDEPGNGPVDPNYSALRIAQLAHTIAASRVSLAHSANQYFAYQQLSTWVTILLGLATTVLVALSSNELFKEEEWKKAGRWVRVGAIALPAAGTAAATLIAFYNPAGHYARSSHALVSLQQLHSQIYTTLWKAKALNCTVGGDESPSIQAAPRSASQPSVSTLVSTSTSKDPSADMTWPDLNIRVDGWWQRYQDIMATALADDSTQSGSDSTSGDNGVQSKSPKKPQ